MIAGNGGVGDKDWKGPQGNLCCEANVLDLDVVLVT